MIRSAEAAHITGTTNPQIERYLSRLQAVLGGMDPHDKEEILREIRGHILDSTENAADRDGSLDRVLRLLGTPEELAARYGTECMLTRASRSFSPWVLLRTCWRWAMLGTKGVVAFLSAVFGYGLALGLTVCVFLKPFVPRVGFWVGPDTFQVGYPDHPETMHELLGQWFVPVMAIMACAIAIGTTQVLRWMISKRTARVSLTPKSGFTETKPV